MTLTFIAKISGVKNPCDVQHDDDVCVCASLCVSILSVAMNRFESNSVL